MAGAAQLDARTALDKLIADVSSGSIPLANVAVGSSSSTPVRAATQPSDGTEAPTAAVEQDEGLQQRVALVRSVGEECVTDAELQSLLKKKPNFVLYDGFEPSGRMHIAQGVFKVCSIIMLLQLFALPTPRCPLLLSHFSVLTSPCPLCFAPLA